MSKKLTIYIHGNGAVTYNTSEPLLFNEALGALEITKSSILEQYTSTMKLEEVKKLNEEANSEKEATQ